MAYSKGMATGLPARWVLVCAVLATAPAPAVAQVPPVVPADRPPVTSPTAVPPTTAPPSAQPTIARVGERRRVAVIDLTDGAAEELTNQLYVVLLNHPDLQPLANVNAERALKGRIRDEEASYLAEAREAKREAEDALGNIDYGRAEIAAERGMQELHNVRPAPEVLGLYAELAFAAGQAALKLRKPNDASLAVGLSHRLDPSKKPDPARYEPEIVEAYSLAHAKISVPATLEVKGKGTVWIDGVDRGPPGTFEVSRGLHLVQLIGPERVTRGTRLDVPALPSIEIEWVPATEERKVERIRLELSRTRDAASRAGAVKRLAQLLGIGDAVLIEKSAEGVLRVQTWRDTQQGFSAFVEYRQGSPAELLHPLAPPRKIEPPPDEVRPFTPPLVETPLYRKRWFQGAVATGVIAVAATIIVFATRDQMFSWDDDVKTEAP